MLFGSVLLHDSSYIITGSTYGSVPNVVKAMTADINASGTVTKLKILMDSTNSTYTLFSNALIENSSGKFVFTGKSQDSLSYLLFGISDKNLDSVSLFRYYTPNTLTYYGYDLVQHEGAYFVAGIRIDSVGYNSNVVLTKIDSSGNRLWEKYYDQYYRDYAASIVKLSNGNLLLGCVREDLNQTLEHANTWLIEVDTGGHMVRQWFDPNDSTYATEGLLQTQDGGFIYCAQKKNEQTVNDVYKLATIVKLDNNFNKQWTFSGGFQGTVTGFTDIVELTDGSFVACGKDNYRNGWIVKLTANGDVIWDKKYVGIVDNGSENYLTDIDVMPDGGFIAVGQCQFLGHNPSQVGWFLKLDSNGCETENCLLGLNDEYAVTESGGIKLYPNPAQNDVTVEYNNILQNSQLFICDVLGNLIETKILNGLNGKLTLNTSGYQNGIYVARVEADGKFLFKDKFTILK